MNKKFKSWYKNKIEFIKEINKSKNSLRDHEIFQNFINKNFEIAYQRILVLGIFTFRSNTKLGTRNWRSPK